MMLKQKSNNWGESKLLALMLMGLFASCAFGDKVEPKQSEILSDGRVYNFVYQMPSFKGRDKALGEFLETELTYPEEAKEKGIQGTVQLRFIVEKDGELSSVEVISSPDSLLSREALRVIRKSPNWNPGMKGGLPVRVNFAMPVRFTDARLKERILGDDVEQPSFKGGDNALKEFLKLELQYPLEAAEKGIEGTVMIRFTVEKDGELTSFIVLKSPDELLSKEALRVLKKMPDWNPATQAGQVIKRNYVMPVWFVLK